MRHAGQLCDGGAARRSPTAAARHAHWLRANYTECVLEVIKLDWAPLTCIRPIGQPSDQELTESLQRITETIEADRRAGMKRVMIVDMRQAGVLGANQRKMASAWMKQNLELYTHFVLGSVFVIHSPVVRGVLTALLWLAPLDMPYEVVGNIDDAARWAIRRLESQRIPVPERMRSELGQALDRR